MHPAARPPMFPNGPLKPMLRFQTGRSGQLPQQLEERLFVERRLRLNFRDDLCRGHDPALRERVP